MQKILLLFSIIFTFFITQTHGETTRLPKELRGKWEGKVFLTNNDTEHSGNIIIGMGGLLAKSEYEIDFTISKFSKHNYYDAKYIENAAKYDFDDQDRPTVSFYYKIPTGVDFKTNIDGNFELTRYVNKDGQAYLFGTFQSRLSNEGVYNVRMVLFPKDAVKKMNQNKELDQVVLTVLEERKESVVARSSGTGGDRINENVTKISDKHLVRINKAAGWIKSRDGQWLEGKNKIQNFDINSKDISKVNEGVFKVGADNFEWIEVRNVTVQGRELLVVIKKMQNHKHREIYDLKDNSEPAITFVVFDKNKATFNKTDNRYETPMFYWNVMPAKESYLSDITSDITTVALKYPKVSKSSGTEQQLYFYFTTSDSNPKIGRFFMYTNKDYVMEHFFLPVPLRTGIIMKEERKELKDFYFELPTDEITPLFNLIK